MSSQVKLEMGYAVFPGALVIETRKSAAFTVPNPNCTSQRRRFFQVWLPRELPHRADHSVYSDLRILLRAGRACPKAAYVPIRHRTDSSGNLLPAWARLGPLSVKKQGTGSSHRRLAATCFAATAHPTGWLSGFPTGRPWVSLERTSLPRGRSVLRAFALHAPTLPRTRALS